jgi:hypothetical protein
MLHVPSHAKNHEWFREFLDTNGLSGYFGSIGGWLKEIGDDEDRGMWYDFRCAKITAYIEERLAKANIQVRWA